MNIAPVDQAAHSFGTQGLNNYQKRLVHQLVRAEHPELVTISRPGFIQIVAYDKEREDNVQKDRTRYFEEKLGKQIGLRWVVEAMVGGHLSGIDSKTLEHTVEGQSEAVTRAFNELRNQLERKRTILVGHNVFLDLINFYRCFFGQLPDRVENFQQAIHKLFPLIIDTKYIATHNVVNPALSKSALEDLDNELSKLPVPVIETHPDHGKYIDTTPAHEAGFDSFLTAKVLIRLSAKLEAAGHYVDENGIPSSDEDEEYATAPEDGGVSLDNATASSEPDPTLSSDASDSSTQGVSLAIAALDAATISQTQTKPKKPKAVKLNRNKPASQTSFSHRNTFDLLDDIPTDKDLLPAGLQPKNTLGGKKGKKNKNKKFTTMPSFESHFWMVYGNKLRVNGTAEGVCNMR